MHLIHAIYEKAFSALNNESDQDQRAKIFENYLNLQLQMLGIDLKKQSLNMAKLELFGYHIFKWFEIGKETVVKGGSKYHTIVQSQHWQNFCKSCLKIGMQIDDNVHSIQQSGLLLHLMAYLCDNFYEDYDEESSVELEEPAQLFEMICTHSKYYDIVLAAKSTDVKTAVLKLLLTLAKKSPTLSLNHLEIPVILGAYQAKLTPTDRYTLALLQLYETYNAQKLKRYRPFIWGESATSFYALHVSDIDERNRLTQQETTITLVMSLIDKHTCEQSIENYPIWRNLDTQNQLPTWKFLDPSTKASRHRGSNDLEYEIERMWDTKTNSLLTAHDLRLCPQSEDFYNNCYDPAFFIPLMSSCFAPEAYAHPGRPVQNGLLAFCFAALSSQDKEMRQAAGIVQLRYRQHFEQSKFFERPLWIQAYDNIQAGLAELTTDWKEKHKKHSKQYVPIPRVSYIPALFIAKTFNITNDPTNLLYKQLTMYLRLMTTFNFQCVPDFNIFFHSPEIEHHTYRQFIIDVLRQGVKCSSDLFLLLSTNTFKVLLSFYGGTMSTLETNLNLLSVMAICVKIPASIKIMIEQVGILPWLQTIVSNLEFYHFDIIESIITIINNLWYAITAVKNQFYNYNYINLEIYNIIITLLPQLSARISSIKMANLFNIMQKSAVIVENSNKPCKPYSAMSNIQLEKLLGYIQKHFLSSQVQYLKNLKNFGGAGADSHISYCTQLYEANVDAISLLALSSLRLFIIDWWQAQQSVSMSVLE